MKEYILISLAIACYQALTNLAIDISEGKEITHKDAIFTFFSQLILWPLFAISMLYTSLKILHDYSKNGNRLR